MAAKSQDKIIFGVALVLLLASAGWMAIQGSKLAALRAGADTNLTSSAYTPNGIDATAVGTKTWPKAPAQTSGSEWVYDVFTPPEIYYDDVTKKFSVTVPGVVAPVIAPKPFGVELVGIRQDVFRLQLVGYLGAEGDYRGNFENAISGETIIGRAGKVINDLGLTIKSFDVKRIAVKSPDSMTTYEIEATAVVVDNKTGEETSLTNKRRHVKGTPFAILKVEGESNTAEYKAGSTFTAGEATFNVISVNSEPPSVEVRKEGADLSEPVTKTLTPAGAIVPVSAPASTPEAVTPSPATTPFPFGN